MKIVATLLAALAGVAFLAPAFAAPAVTTGKICNVLHYGAKNDNSTDASAAIQQAFNACVRPNQPNNVTLLIPAGTYLIAKNLYFSGSGWIFNMKGTLVIAFDPKLVGNMLGFSHVSNFEFKGHGTIDGQGRLWTVKGSWSYYGGRPRLLRFDPITHSKIHDVRLYDAPMFHMTVLGNHTEVWNVRIHGEDHGATDGIDIGGWNNHVHNVHVTNRDECVTVKSPSNNILIERVFCDNAGATNIGSVGSGGGTAMIENIVMRNNIYYESEWAVGIKAFPCGNGFIRNVTWENLIVKSVVYPVDIDMTWLSCAAGVANGNLKISDITIRNVTGTSATSRPSMKFNCLPNSPCENIKVIDSHIWRDDGTAAYYSCNYAGGTGACLGKPTTTTTEYFKPTSHPVPAWNIPSSGWPLTDTLGLN